MAINFSLTRLDALEAKPLSSIENEITALVGGNHIDWVNSIIWYVCNAEDQCWHAAYEKIFDEWTLEELPKKVICDMKTAFWYLNSYYTINVWYSWG